MLIQVGAIEAFSRKHKFTLKGKWNHLGPLPINQFENYFEFSHQ